MSDSRTLYVLIDDDETNNMLTDFVIRDVEPLANVYSFSDAKIGLVRLTEFLYSGYRCVLLLDINMPVLSGWDVLDNLVHTPPQIRSLLTVVMLSSSVSAEDKKRALECPLVVDYFEKPMTVEKVQVMMNKTKMKSAA